MGAPTESHHPADARLRTDPAAATTSSPRFCIPVVCGTSFALLESSAFIAPSLCVVAGRGVFARWTCGNAQSATFGQLCVDRRSVRFAQLVQRLSVEFPAASSQRPAWAELIDP